MGGAFDTESFFRYRTDWEKCRVRVRDRGRRRDVIVEREGKRERARGWGNCRGRALKLGLTAW